MTDRPAPAEGYVFAATGKKYTILARRAARTLRKVAPDAVIDLFVDQPLDDPVFDVVHRLNETGFRPKMEALYRSRFDRTIHLDSDVVAVADPGDIFRTLDRFDIAAAHVNTRSFPNALEELDTPLPNAFPAYNSGVLGVRRTAAVQQLLRDWERVLRERKMKVDQPILRELLFASDLRIATLPVEYNLMAYELLAGMKRGQTAPRLLHLRKLHLRDADPGNPEHPFDLEKLLPPFHRRRIEALLSCDRTLGGEADPATVFPLPQPPQPLRVRLRRSISRRLRRVLNR